MKLRYALLATALLSTTVFAGQTDPSLASSKPEKRLSGDLTMGYNTNYVGRGIVISHSVAEGDSTEFAALRYNYDFGKKSAWSLDGVVAYTVASSGHTLYGNPDLGYNHWCAMGGEAAVSAQVNQLANAKYGTSGVDFWNSGLISDGEKEAYKKQGYTANPRKIKEANLENEFVVRTAAKFTQEKWNVAFGHTFVHGGILGVMAKHYRDQGASCTNEFFIAPEVTPYKWLSIGCTTSFSCQGITGWWFEPHVRAMAPIIGHVGEDGSVQDLKLLGVVELGLSATADYFQSRYFACANGTQAFWIKLSTPYFVTDRFILTPSVSFNWLGKGALKANEKSEYREYSEDATNVPFRNAAVVGGISATYKF